MNAALALTTGCNEKSGGHSSATTSQIQAPPTMKRTTPLSPSITTPDAVDTATVILPRLRLPETFMRQVPV
jgi:hypothetical protein